MATELEIGEGMLEEAREANDLFRFDMNADNQLALRLVADAEARTALLKTSLEATRLWQAEMLKAAQAQAAALQSTPAGSTVSRRHAAVWLMAEAIRNLGSAKAAGALVEEYLAELDRIAPEA